MILRQQKQQQKNRAQRLRDGVAKVSSGQLAAVEEYFLGPHVMLVASEEFAKKTSAKR